MPILSRFPAVSADSQSAFARGAWLLAAALLAASPVRGVELNFVARSAWPDHPIAGPQAVIAAGDIAWVGSISGAPGEEGLTAVDVSDPDHPRRLGGLALRLAAPYDRIADLALSGDILFAAAEQAGVHIIDISEPALPRRLGSIEADAAGLAIRDRLLLVTEWESARVQIHDISNPREPQMLGSFESPFGQPLVGVAVAGDRAYVNSWQAGLLVLDISDPAHPELMGHYDTPGLATGGIAVRDNLVFVADLHRPYPNHAIPSGVRIIDVTDPAAPVETGVLPGLIARDVVVVDHLAYVAAIGDAGLRIFDISDAEQPVALGALDSPGEAQALALTEERALLADGPNGLRIVDVSIPSTPMDIGGYGGNAHVADFAVTGDLAVVTAGPAGLQLLDLSDPGSLKRAGRLPLRDWEPGEPLPDGVTIRDGIAWVSYPYSGLQAVDLHDPHQPSELSFTPIGARGENGLGRAALLDSHALVGLGNAGIAVVDISNPSAPKVAASYRGVYTFGGRIEVVAAPFAWVAGRPGDFDGLSLLDVSNPLAPVRRGTFLPGTYVHAIEPAGDFLYVAAGAEGLLVFDVSDPRSPRALATVGEAGFVSDVSVSDGVAWLADESWSVRRLTAVDVRDPSSPGILARWGGIRAEKVMVRGDSLLVAGGGRLRLVSVLPGCEPRFSGATGFTLLVRGLPGQATRLERSRDLQAWLPWKEVLATGDVQEFADPESNAATPFFYRSWAP